MADPAAQTVALVESLKYLGLTKYEALVYISLLHASDAMVNEIHKLSGVPRAGTPFPETTGISLKYLSQTI